jgi:Protein of unknown function (DUF1570)
MSQRSSAGRRLHISFVLSIIAAIALAAACATARQPRIVSLPNPSVHPVSHIAHVFDNAVAAETIASIFQRDFGFDRFPVVFFFCDDRRALEAALLESGYEPTLARNTAQTMDAIGGHRRVLVNALALTRQPWPGRVASLAHEMAHSLQYEWGGGRRGTSDQWLREGFAEWLSMQVMDRLRALPFQESRRQYRNAIQALKRSDLPRLSQMVTFPEWVEINRRGNRAAYAQAFVAVDFLIERHGLPKVVDYFRRFAESEDRAANFTAAFGEDLQAFEEALRERGI